MSSAAASSGVVAGESRESVFPHQDDASGSDAVAIVARGDVAPFAGGAIVTAGAAGAEAQGVGSVTERKIFAFPHMMSVVNTVSPTPASPITAAPEPASLALLGTGALGAVAVLRRRTRLR